MLGAGAESSSWLGISVRNILHRFKSLKEKLIFILIYKEDFALGPWAPAENMFCFLELRQQITKVPTQVTGCNNYP